MSSNLEGVGALVGNGARLLVVDEKAVPGKEFFKNVHHLLDVFGVFAPNINVVHVPRSFWCGWRLFGVGSHALIVTLDWVLSSVSPTRAEKATGESGPPCLTPVLWQICTLV